MFIAVIDDDESFCIALVESLRSLGYDARGLEADASCDCVITDIHMPGMSGLELARLLRARARELPVVLVTARSDFRIDAHTAANGAICLLRKPFNECLDRLPGQGFQGLRHSPNLAETGGFWLHGRETDL